MQIDVDVVFLGGAAPGVDLHDAGNGEQAPLQYPILHRAQIGQPEMRRPDHLIAVDFANEARALDLRHHVVRQVDVLLQIDRGLRQREIIVDVVLEHDADERQAVERGRADDVDARRRGEPDLDRDGEVALHLLGRLAGRLRGDLQDHRRRIRIGFDVEPGKGEHAGDDEHQQAQKDQRTTGQDELQHAAEHVGPFSAMSFQFDVMASMPGNSQRDAVASVLLRNSAPSVATSSPVCTPSRICR